jgi:hypothetical protein
VDHGKDYNVLQSRGLESRLLTFPDEVHDMEGVENSLVSYTVVLNWCMKFVRLPLAGEEVEMQSQGWSGRD